MATYSVTRAKNATLSSTTVDTITLNQKWEAVEITNADASNALYVRVDGTAATAAGDDCTMILPASSKVIALGGSTTVSIIGNGNVYSCEGVK